MDMPCIRKHSHKCYEWCKNWAEPGASKNCEKRCMDYADQQSDYFKFNSYTFGLLLPRMKKYQLLENKDDKF